MLSAYFRSIVESDPAPVVICDCSHTILYMNPAAVKAYEKWGGAELIGKNIFGCHSPKSRETMEKIFAWFQESSEHNMVHTSYNPVKNKDVYMYAIRDEEGNLIGYYEKHEFRTRDEHPFYEMA